MPAHAVIGSVSDAGTASARSYYINSYNPSRWLPYDAGNGFASGMGVTRSSGRTVVCFSTRLGGQVRTYTNGRNARFPAEGCCCCLLVFQHRLKMHVQRTFCLSDQGGWIACLCAVLVLLGPLSEHRRSYHTCATSASFRYSN